MSNLRFAIWEGTVHVARPEAHDWTHALCNARGGPTGETQFTDRVDMREPFCGLCVHLLADELDTYAEMLARAVAAAVL